MSNQTMQGMTVDVAMVGWNGRFAQWLAEEKARSDKTLAAYERDLAGFCRWFEQANGQAFAPALMNSMDAKAWREFSLEVERVAPATWNRRRATLALLCQWIEEALKLPMFPFERRVPRAEAVEQAPRWLSQSEERGLMRQLEINVAAARTELQRQRAIRDRAMVAVMRYAGLRVEEVAGLELGDLSLSERKGNVVVRRGKRDKWRVAPLSSSAREALGAWLAIRGNGAGALFTDEHGTGISVRGIQKRVEELARQLGMEGLSCHALRHTCAKSMIDAARPLTEAQVILGHSKIETTARYTQAGREDLAEAVEAGELGKLRRK